MNTKKSSHPITIGIVDDYADVREALECTLQQVSSWRILPPCKNEKEGRALLENVCPDLFLVDLALPFGGCGITLIRRARELWGERCLSVVLSANRSEDTIMVAIEAGAVGYLNKDSERATWVTQLQNLLQGTSPLNAELARLLVSALQYRLSPGQRREHIHLFDMLRYVASGHMLHELGDVLQLPAEQAGQLARRAYTLLQQDSFVLSVRQRQLLDYLSLNLSEQECAERLGLQLSSVKTHRQRLYEKLGAGDRPQALLIARQRGLL